jgi:hypothetical protein
MSNGKRPAMREIIAMEDPVAETARRPLRLLRGRMHLNSKGIVDPHRQPQIRLSIYPLPLHFSVRIQVHNL